MAAGPAPGMRMEGWCVGGNFFRAARRNFFRAPGRRRMDVSVSLPPPSCSEPLCPVPQKTKIRSAGEIFWGGGCYTTPNDSDPRLGVRGRGASPRQAPTCATGEFWGGRRSLLQFSFVFPVLRSKSCTSNQQKLCTTRCIYHSEQTHIASLRFQGSLMLSSLSPT